MSIDKVGVLGAGQMGRGISQVLAQSGALVLLADVDRSFSERGRDRIGSDLQRLVDKGKLTAGDRGKILENIRPVEDVGAFAEAGFVIEAVSEDEAVKAKLFAAADEVVGESTILATNTSSISITRLAATTHRPDRVIGMHFMNPVPVMRLVEIIRGHATSDTTYDATVQLAKRVNKEVVTSVDYPGFIVNRVLMPMINEAAFALMEGVASASDIDKAMQLGTNQPLGPLALADLIGLDTTLAILNVLHTGLGDPKYRPCPLLRRLVDARKLGRKTGEGFHRYA